MIQFSSYQIRFLHYQVGIRGLSGIQFWHVGAKIITDQRHTVVSMVLYRDVYLVIFDVDMRHDEFLCFEY